MYKIILCGDGIVGKTSLRRSYIGKDFRERYLMTLGADITLKEIFLNGPTGEPKSCKCQIWDLAGQPIFSSVRPMYYLGAHAAIIVYDVTRLSSFNNVTYWVNEVLKGLKYKAIPFVIVANKIDLRNNFDLALSNQEGKDLAFNITKELLDDQMKTSYIETSAKTGEKVSEMFIKAANLVYQTFEHETIQN